MYYGNRTGKVRRMRQRKIRNTLSLLMIIALLLSACGERKSQETSAAAPEETSAPETTAAPKIIGTMHAPSAVVEESVPDTVEPETGAGEEKPPEDKILFWTENTSEEPEESPGEGPESLKPAA